MNQFLKAIVACCIVFVLTSCASYNKQPDKLVVERLDPLHQSNAAFKKNIEDEEEVKKLYDKILRLPSFPRGRFNCPSDNGVQYELTFTLASKDVSKAIVDATGCQGVTMNKKTYSTLNQKGRSFRALLEQEIGLSD